MIELIKKSYKMSIVYSILFIIIGALLFIDPAGFVILVSYLIGLLLIFSGLINIINYSKSKEIFGSKALLTFGIILLMLGIFLIVKPTFIGKVVPSIIGICLLINSIEKLVFLKYVNEKNTESYIISMISGFVALLAGGFLIFNPLSGTLIVTQIIGVIIIIYSVIDLIEKFRYKNGFNQPKSKIKIIDEE